MKRLLTILLLATPFQVFSQQPIYVTIAGGDLYKLDISNCSSIFVGSTGQGFGDIAFTPDGRLWGIVGGQLYAIDTTTANATLIGNTGIGAVSLVGLDDSTLLAESAMKLYRININNAISYYIDTIGYQASGDLTWYDYDLYMTSGGQLIKMLLNESNTDILSVDTINSSINPMPTCEGLATASFEFSDNAIIGLSNNNVYKFCQLDGEYEMLCPSIVPGGMPGGASIRLPLQIPQPISCSLTAIEEQADHISVVQAFPNPFSAQTVVKSNVFLKDATLTIYNSIGQEVNQVQHIFGYSVTLSRDNLLSGLYFIRMNQDQKLIANGRLAIMD